ncbi:hypothetical protein [Citrobacter amalonaticus]|uniref:hypothetical protein n=1 Tax=Citrobacter amalonaticus TaxID=35703 RepID=UPI001A340A70|nr:hypothetical protein [Citrobacter amalonaticus]HDQ2812706.1 hypothetical protein [Citrobacter amalonaticus]
MIKIIPDNTGNKIVIQEIIGIVKVKITTAELRDVPSRRFDKPEAHLASRRMDSSHRAFPENLIGIGLAAVGVQ